MSRKATFVLALTYLIILLGIGVLYFVKRNVLFFITDQSFGPVAVGIPWFGALGAVLISLTGVFEHEKDWDASYGLWHVARPLVGAALGVVSVLILQAGVLSVNGRIQQPAAQTQTPASTQNTDASTATPSTPSTKATPPPTGAANPAPTAAASSASPAPTTAPTATQTLPASTPAKQSSEPKEAQPSNLLYYLVAFLVGYREETFRELIKRLVDVVLSPGNKPTPAPSIHAVAPTTLPHNAPGDVAITGSGFTSTQSVKFGNSAAKFKVDTDGQITATTPNMAAAGTVSLTVITKGGSASVNFDFS